MTVISVIIPMYNAAATVEACLEALSQQSVGRECYEVVVVDNNSTDESGAIVKRYPVVLLHEGRQGAYAARNRALQVAEGPLIAFTDPDCVPHPDWLRRLIEAMEDPEA
jgi:glycosyltransferase involved in cell wall biosynthesis